MTRFLPSLLFACAAVLRAQTGSPDIVISQIYGGGGNAGATLRNDFIELFNRGKQVIDLGGWSVQYGSAAGDLSQTTPLSGTIQPGRYFLVQQAAGSGGSADLPQPDAAGTIAMSATAGKVAVFRGQTIVDLVGYGAADRFEGSRPAPGLSNTTAAVRRRAGCQDTDSNQADFQERAPEPRNSRIEPVVDCDAPPPVPTSMRISEVQGPGAESPVAGRLVMVRGVVTERRSNGFWIESLPGEADTDPRTSEGLFVFTSSNPPAVAARGNIVNVAGTVAEFRPAADPDSAPLTELIEPEVTFISTTTAVRVPPVLPPSGDWQRYEGMIVSFSGTVAGATLGSVDEPTGTAASSGVLYLAAPGARPFRDVSGLQGPSLLRVDTRALGGTIDINTGAFLTVEGPLDFTFQNYSVVARPREFTDRPPIAIPPPPPIAQEFTIASMNLQRLFDDKDDPGVGDVVVQTEAYQRRITRMARVIGEKLWSPDVIGVQEAENIDVLRALATAAGNYEAFLFEGNDPGGIDVGLLVKRGRVQVLGVAQEGKSAILPNNDVMNDRPPIVARLRVASEPVTVIVNHLRSLIGVGTPSVDLKRRAQAEYLRDLIARLRTEGNERIISIGDYNNFQFDPLMRMIGLRNLTDTLPPTDGYSFIQDGVVQTLDHMLVTDTLFQRLTRYHVLRVNADYPEVYRNDINRLERYSDHDVPIAYFSLTGSVRLSAAGVTNAATFLGGPVAPNEIVTLFGRGLGPSTGVSLTSLPALTMLGGTRVLFDGIEAGLIYASNDRVTAIVPDGIRDRSNTEIRVEYLRMAPVIVTVPVAITSPGIFATGMNGTGQGAILNQNFTVNGPGNPAERGSIVMIYGTGNACCATVSIGRRDAEVLYQGPAPGLVNGAYQINARVPDDVEPGSAVSVIVWAAGRASAPGVTMAVR